MTIQIKRATLDDAAEILEIQKEAFIVEAQLYNDYNIQPLVQTSEENLESFKKCVVLKLIIDNTIAGSIRAYLENNICFVQKLIIRTKFQGKGYSYLLLEAIEKHFKEASEYQLFTGYLSHKNLHIYKKMGYEEFKREKDSESVTFVFMRKS